MREVGGDNYSYANDYEVITRLKQFADSYGICILIVHHTRKQGSDDKFDMISGTTEACLVRLTVRSCCRKKNDRQRRHASKCRAETNKSRNSIFSAIPETLLWDFQKAETELWREPPEPLLEEIDKRITADCPFMAGDCDGACGLAGNRVTAEQPCTETECLVGASAQRIRHFL